MIFIALSRISSRGELNVSLRALAKSIEGDAELVEAKTLARRAGVVFLRVTSLLGCTRQALVFRSPVESPRQIALEARATSRAHRC